MVHYLMRQSYFILQELLGSSYVSTIELLRSKIFPLRCYSMNEQAFSPMFSRAFFSPCSQSMLLCDEIEKLRE